MIKFKDALGHVIQLGDIIVDTSCNRTGVVIGGKCMLNKSVIEYVPDLDSANENTFFKNETDDAGLIFEDLYIITPQYLGIKDAAWVYQLYDLPIMQNSKFEDKSLVDLNNFVLSILKVLYRIDKKGFYQRYQYNKGRYGMDYVLKHGKKMFQQYARMTFLGEKLNIFLEANAKNKDCICCIFHVGRAQMEMDSNGKLTHVRPFIVNNTNVLEYVDIITCLNNFVEKCEKS